MAGGVYSKDNRGNLLINYGEFGGGTDWEMLVVASALEEEEETDISP